MNPRTYLAVAAALLIPVSAMAADDITSLHPEEAYPDNAPMLTSPGPYTAFMKDVQQKLHGLGFDAGPVNGDFGTKTQAALAQFQLSRDLPASGTLDERTLGELGVKRDEQAAADASADAAADASAGASGATDQR
jgi:peptidoglycan hydrolase-like protein with peptidoglycan-binding domain